VKAATIARNYAEALFAAAAAKQDVERFGAFMDAVAGAVQADERISLALESPRVAKRVKTQLLADALAETAPPEFVRFLQATVRRGRQGLLVQISQEYQKLLDVKLNRVHAGVTLSGERDAELEQLVTDRLAAALGKEIRAHFRSDPRILGGVVVRVGDRVHDGSLRRRMAVLKRRMLTGE
jgi:F-type H+-transporting ATPase subunit delta